MKRCVVLLILTLAVAHPSTAQEFPKPTPAGEKALDELIERCVEAGGLKRVEGPKAGTSTPAPGDAAKLKIAVEQARATLTPALFDALIARWRVARGEHKAAVVDLLRIAGEVADNPRALAYSMLFEGFREGQIDQAISLLEDAARRFEACEEWAWRAGCYNQIGAIYYGKGRSESALKMFLKALEIRRAALGERHRDVATSYNNIASAYHAQGEYAKALEAHLKALEIRRAVLGDRHPEVAQSYDNIAVVHSSRGEPAKALEACLKALEIWLAALGERHPVIATSYNSIAIIYNAQGEHAKALETYLKALEIRRATLGERHPLVAETYDNIALVYRDRGDYAKALENHLKSLEIRRATLGDRHPDVASSYDGIGLVYYAQGEYAKALEVHLKALEIRRASLGERHPHVASSYDGIGLAYYAQGEYGNALEAHLKALEIRRAAQGDRHRDVASSYVGIATVLGVQGEHAKAMEAYLKALEIRRAALGDRHLDVASIYQNMGIIYRIRGEYSEALEMSLKSLDIYRAGLSDRHPVIAASYNNIANIYDAQGEYAKALEAHLKALEIGRATLGEHHPAVASSYVGIALVLGTQGEHAKALEVHLKALEIRRAALGERHPEVAQSYDNIAVVHSSRGEPAKALEACLKALEIWLAALGERHPVIATSYNNIASVYYAQGEHAKALETFLKALEIRRAALGDRHPTLAVIYSNLARVYHQRGEHRLAVESFDNALFSLGLAVKPTEDGTSSRDLPSLGPVPLAPGIFTMRGQLREALVGADPTSGLTSALDDYRSAADALDRLREATSRDDDKVGRGEDVSEVFPHAVGVLAWLAASSGRVDPLVEAFSFAERGSARVFLEGLGRSRASAGGRVDPATLAEEGRLSAEIREIDGRITLEQNKPFEKRDKDKVERLFGDRKKAEAAWQSLMTRMEQESPQYAALKRPRPCTIAEARACLAEDEVALLYVLGTEASYLLVLSAKDDPTTAGIASHKLPPSGQIAEVVAGLTQAKVLEDSDATRERGEAAFQMLLAPAADSMKGKRLVIVPGGGLGQLPFELLAEPFGEGKTRFLVQGHSIRYAPSLTALHHIGRWERERPKPGSGLWALGDPVYAPNDSRLTNAGEPSAEATRLAARLRGGASGATFERLEGTGLEVNRLAGLMGSKAEERLMGSDATEAAVKRLSANGTLAKYRYVHFACHGVLGSGKNAKPGLVLSQVGNPEDQDGYLRMDEVTDLRLNADLVTLSACQTGQGQVFKAEGVSGLARAFLYAGSRGVLCSLWSVNDAATSDLMSDFYANLKAGQSSADALRAAQLKMIEADEPPLHWAPFVLIGR